MTDPFYLNYLKLLEARWHTIFLAEEECSEQVSIAIVICSNQDALEKRVAELVLARVRMGIAELHNPEEEEYCVQELSDQAVVDWILTGVGDINSKKEDESNDNDNALPPLKKQLRMVALTMRICLSSRYADDAVWKGFRKAQSSFCADIFESQKQTKMDPFFK